MIDISKLTAAELDELIAKAAARRAGLEPPISNEAPKQTQAPFDPRWVCYTSGENTVLQIQHLGLGWITVIIPPHERANLLTLLLRQALLPAQAKVAEATAANAGGGQFH